MPRITIDWARRLVWGLPIVFGVGSAALSNLWRSESDGLAEWADSLEIRLLEHLPRVPANPSIVLVVVTKDSAKRLMPADVVAPLSRRVLAETIRRLDEDGCSVVLSDIGIDESAPSNVEMWEELRKVSRAKVVFSTQPEPNPQFADTPGGTAYRFPGTAAPRDLSNTVFFGHPQTFSPQGVAVGFCPLIEDFGHDKRVVLHAATLASLLYRRLNPGSTKISDDGETLEVGEGQWPIGGNGDITGLWTASRKAFPEVPIEGVLSGDAAIRKLVRDKIVVIGDMRRTNDVVQTYVFGQVPGPEFMAQCVNTMLASNTRRPQAVPVEGTVAWAALLAAAASAFLLSGKRPLMILGSAGTFVIASAAPFTVAAQGKLMEIVVPSLAVLLSVVLSLACLALAYGRIDRRREGSAYEGVVLFMDIRDSTGKTRSAGDKAFQREYADFIRWATAIVTRRHGEIERTTGDGFIAVFHSASSLSTVKNAFHVATELTRPHGRFGRPRVALEFGAFSGGYVSESGRRTWSSTGATVILAQRLMSACDELSVDLAIGPMAAELLHTDVALHCVGEVLPKGFDSPVKVYSAAQGPQ